MMLTRTIDSWTDAIERAGRSALEVRRKVASSLNPANRIRSGEVRSVKMDVMESMLSMKPVLKSNSGGGSGEDVGMCDSGVKVVDSIDSLSLLVPWMVDEDESVDEDE